MAIRRINPYTDINHIDFTTLSILRIGTSGADTMRGGAGRDSFNGLDGNDTFIGNGGVDTFNGGEGTDTVDYSTMPTELQPEGLLGRTGVIVNLAQGVGGEFNEGFDTYSSIENVTGSNFKDALVGDANVNVLRGMDGDDMIDGGAGGDTLDGGAGSDTLSYSGSNARVTVNLQTGSASGGHATGDVISLFENLIGSEFNDTLTGNGGDNVIMGGAGGDTLDGAGGLNDTVSYRNSNAGVTVNLLTGFAGGGHATGDTITHFENIEGSSFGDTLIGSTLDNVILGGGGNDTMTGGLGHDTFTFKLADNTGNDHITDFNVFEDKLQIDVDNGAFPALSFVAVDALHQNVIFDLGNGDTLTLDNVSIVDAALIGLGAGVELV